MAEKVDEVLYRLGANKAYLGFRYVVHCVGMILENEELRYYIKVPYVDAAAHYRTSVGCVERNVRTLVALIWEKGDREMLNEIACRELAEKPKSKEFLVMIAEYTRRMLELQE